ncbi:MAG: 23S rRNA (guanosine(2251)-2'-O)-methyltransferase RlmB [Candidatus Latescibacterota bacterium]|nr:MAG: 23S rRNA (guanosine(2251)-2'-O)-methyltransferase RlmB [Candidatus Latescibacterota bacterium]
MSNLGWRRKFIVYHIIGKWDTGFVMAKNYMYLYGRNSVLERIQTRPETIRQIYLREELSLPRLEKAIDRAAIRCERIDASSLDKMRPQKDLQGVVAKVDKFAYTPSDQLIDTALQEARTILFLDRVNDPHNLGVIIRLSACFGGFSLIIPTREACQVNETVLHVASGGENYVPIASVNNLAPAIDEAKKLGYWIVGAVVDEDAEDIAKVSLPFPLGVVMGSEGTGIRKGLQKRLDIRAYIPMGGAPLSFNVSMACAIFCHEIAKQKSATGGTDG